MICLPKAFLSLEYFNAISYAPIAFPNAKAEIDSIYANTNHAYHKPYDKDHKNAVEHMRQLHEKVFGNK